jgi:beta-mannosidase
MLEAERICSNATEAKKRVSLDGEWAARMCDPGLGEAEGWESEGFDAELTAIVPGHLQRDLVRAGLESDFNYGENARAFASREGKDWWLSREFEVDDPSQRMELCFHGIDTDADAWLNGVHLGHHSNAHIAWTIDVSAALRRGGNRLVVRLDDGTRPAATREYDRYSGLADQGLEDLDPRMWVRKPQYVWRWDWVRRLLTCGIWRPVELRGYDAVALRDVQLRTLFADDGTATVEATCEIECFVDPEEGVFELALTGGSGTHVATVPIAARSGTQQVSASVEIVNPELWWPAPLGEPALYDCRVAVSKPSGCDERGFRYGLRTVELEKSDLGEDGESFTFVVNGVPLFCKGSGWQPPELLFGCVDDAKLRHLIELAAAANMNMLRVNGCGTYESDLFYELCDRHGILVWQDFPFTCAYYPDDDDGFCEAVRGEAESAIRRLRNHASLAIWCGSNETEWMHAQAADPANPFGLTPAPRFYGERLYYEILPAVCARLDPDRPYLPSTPWAGNDDPNSDAAGSRHVWEYQLLRQSADRVNFSDIELDASKFVAEFGYLGPSELSSLQRFIPEDELQPGSASWEFHDNYFEDGVTETAIERYWAPVDAIGLDDYVALGQLFQAEALGAAVRHWRRRMFRTSGAISWGYLDCWGTSTSWSLVDYYERPRAAYFHARRAFEPLQVSLQQEGDSFAVWVVNDLPLDQEGTLELGFVDLVDSRKMSHTAQVFARATAAQLASRLDLPSEVRMSPERFVAYAHLQVGNEVVSRARATLVGFEYSRLQLPPPRVSANRSDDAIELRAESYAFQVHVSTAGGAVPHDNWFDLLPGETRTIALPQPEDQAITCWSFADGRKHPCRVLIAEL